MCSKSSCFGKKSNKKDPEKLFWEIFEKSLWRNSFLLNFQTFVLNFEGNFNADSFAKFTKQLLSAICEERNTKVSDRGLFIIFISDHFMLLWLKLYERIYKEGYGNKYR